MANCRNCGAPLKGDRCQYCGTYREGEEPDEIVYLYMGKEVIPTEEMMYDPKLLVTTRRKLGR